MVTSQQTSLVELVESNIAPAIARAQTIPIQLKQRSRLLSINTSAAYDQARQRMNAVFDPLEGDSESPSQILILSNGLLSPRRLSKVKAVIDEAKFFAAGHINLLDKVLFHKRDEFPIEEKSALVNDAINHISEAVAALYCDSDYMRVRSFSRELGSSNKPLTHGLRDVLDEKNVLYIELMNEFAKLKLRRTAALAGIDKEITEAYFNLYSLEQDHGEACPTEVLYKNESPASVLDVDSHAYQKIISSFMIESSPKKAEPVVVERQVHAPTLQERIFAAVTDNLNHGTFTPYMEKCIQLFAGDVASLNFSETEIEGLMASLRGSEFIRNMKRRELRLSDKGVQTFIGDIRVPIVLGKIPTKAEINGVYAKVKGESPLYSN